MNDILKEMDQSKYLIVQCWRLQTCLDQKIIVVWQQSTGNSEPYLNDQTRVYLYAM